MWLDHPDSLYNQQREISPSSSSRCLSKDNFLLEAPGLLPKDTASIKSVSLDGNMMDLRIWRDLFWYSILISTLHMSTKLAWANG